MRYHYALLACVLVTAKWSSICPTSTTWAQVEGPVTISNGWVRLTVNPSVGRIVDFGRVEGPNLMRITDPTVLTAGKADRGGYQGYGGDQLWPAQQTIWGDIRGSGGTWPPLDELDGPNWNITDQGPLHVTITLPQTPLLGLVGERRMELSADSPHVSITNTFTRTAIADPDETFPVHIWSVTGIVEPEFVLADISRDKPAGTADWVRLANNPTRIVRVINEGQALRFDNQAHGPGQSPSQNGMKLGSLGNWLAAIYPDSMFMQTNQYDPDGSFPDGASLEIYSSQSSGSEYVELEVLSTNVDLLLGESLTNRVQWHLLERPSGLTDDELAAYLRAVPEPSSALLLALGVLLFLVNRGVKARSFRGP